MDNQNIVYVKIKEGGNHNDYDSLYVIEEPFDPYNRRRSMLNDKDGQKFNGYNFELRLGTNFLKFYYGGKNNS